MIDHILNSFKSSYHFEKKVIAPSLMQKILDYDWPGNVRQLQHMIERALLFSGKEEIITEKHFRFEEEGNRNRQNRFSPDEVVSLAEMERRMVMAALKKTNNHRTKAAELLGITVRTLRNKLNEYEQQSLRET